MKKERMKRICNYFMKGLLLCALVFGFWFMADAGVNASENNINIDRTGNVEIVSLSRKDDDETNYLNVTNSTGKAIKVTFEHDIERTDHNYQLRIYVGKHECVSRENPVAKDANVLYLYPYQPSTLFVISNQLALFRYHLTCVLIMHSFIKSKVHHNNV